MESQGDVASMLKPFHDRAELAEERLSKLEEAFQSIQTDSPTPGPNVGETRSEVNEEDIVEGLMLLRAMMEVSREEQIAEKEKAKAEKAAASVENQKLQYQVVHLKRSLKEADEKIEKMEKMEEPKPGAN